MGFISPVVARIAGEQGVDLTQVPGTGQGGRITKKDILAYIEGRQKGLIPEKAAPAIEKATPEPLQVPTPAPGEILPHTPVRRAIAEHMLLSRRTSPHVTTVMEADLSRVVAALKAYPIVNSSWSEEGVVLQREINIGMATSLGEAGLIVPVICNADSLSLLGLARAINDLANRARARQLKPDEVKGGTFTITNHGISGSLFATPIINQPQCSILGVGAIQKRAVVIADAIAIRPMVYVSLTFDHRILDGASADAFLAKVVESLQEWK